MPIKRRVVITGMGAITPLGEEKINNVATLWQGVTEGRSGVTRLNEEGYEGILTQIAGRIKSLTELSSYDEKAFKRFDRYTILAFLAAKEALTQAGLDKEAMDPSRVGTYVATGAGGLSTLLDNHKIFLERGSNRVSPFFVPMHINNIASGLLAMKTGFMGPSFSPASACASSNHAIGEAYLKIAYGYADAMLTGGAEAPINPLYFAGFSKMRAMSLRNETPQKASRPFDKDRDGFVMGEGAGLLMLETLEHAKARGATILGEIIGYGSSADAYHMTAPHPRGAIQAMKEALRDANLEKEGVDYINAHGTSTPAGDRSEVEAITTLFEEQASHLKVSSTKSMTGHLFGAAGGVEAIITLKTLATGILPPTINLDAVDEACALNHIPHTAKHKKIKIALSNGFGFGGQNAVLVFKRYGD